MNCCRTTIELKIWPSHLNSQLMQLQIKPDERFQAFNWMTMTRLVTQESGKRYLLLPFHPLLSCVSALTELSSSTIKVIPLKLFYYQTFFETWRNEHSWYEHWENAIKKWGHRACLHVSGLLKWGIFIGCALKILITFIQRQVLITRKTQSFILNVKLHLLT